MPILKRATKKLRDQGIALNVVKGLYGPYLEDPTFRHQRGKVYKDVDAAITAAVNGERPIDLDKQTKEDHDGQ